jgi:hypothetical protein
MSTYSSENPQSSPAGATGLVRRSLRISSKPVPKYFTEQDEQDEVVEAIEAFCAKKGYEYSDDLVTEFDAWLPTAEKWDTKKYDLSTGNYIPLTKPDIAKKWAMYRSKSLLAQKKKQKFGKAIINYCKKNNFVYDPMMDEKFSEWKTDPVNKNLVTYTYTTYTTSYYERTPTECVKKWFSTLKKTVVI